MVQHKRRAPLAAPGIARFVAASPLATLVRACQGCTISTHAGHPAVYSGGILE